MLTPLPSLLEQSVAFGFSAAFTWPVSLVWLGFVLVAAASLRDRTKFSTKTGVSPSVFWLALLAIFPVAMLCIGAIFWERAATNTYSHPAAIALFILVGLQILVSYASVWIFRSRRTLSLGVSALGIVWGLGAFFVSGFAISGTWP